MKKAILLGVVASAMGFYACKKDGTTTTITNTTRDTTIINQFASGVANPDTLSAGIKVAYGTNVSGTFPTSSTDAAAPVLDAEYNKTYTVVKSRYLVIYPPATKGNILGYYVQIAGASSYFKVDYTKEYGIRKNNTASDRSDVEGNYDSTIVLKLPTTIKGDTFYVKYAAYDAQNRVSNAITATALVQPEADDEFTNKASGKWLYYGVNYYNEGQWDYDDYQVVTEGSLVENLTCIGDKPSRTGEGSYAYGTVQYYSNTRQFDIGKYSFYESYIYKERNLDFEASSCGNFIYKAAAPRADTAGYGGYSYDPISKNVTFIYEYANLARVVPGQSNLGFYSRTFKLVELTDSYLILSYTDISDDNNTISFFKYIKQ